LSANLKVRAWPRPDKKLQTTLRVRLLVYCLTLPLGVT